jgi:3-oxoacyl-[acyl-carrier-protein] synthase III
MVESNGSRAPTAGIAGMGYYIPTGILTSREMAHRSGIPEEVFRDKIGIDQKHIAGPDEHPAQMGKLAADRALKDAGIPAEEIDLIAYCALGHYDYHFWSPSAKIQGGIGAENAYAFEVRNGCNSGNLGLTICKNLLLGDPDLKNALVICSDKLSPVVNYQDPSALSSFTFADGAAAAVVQKDCPQNRLLSYAGISEGNLVDYARIRYGGTRCPATQVPATAGDCFFSVSDPDGLDKIFSVTYMKNYTRVIREALKKSGHTTHDIDHLFMNQVKQSISRGLLQELGLPQSSTMVTLRKYGHMGPVDTIFGLARAQEDQLIHPGDIVVLAGSAIGFTWAASVLEFSLLP